MINRDAPGPIINRRAALAGVAASVACLTEVGPFATTASAITTRISDVRTIDQYIHALAEANRLNDAAIVDIAADWCDYCRVIDGRIMRAPRVLDSLADFAIIRVDVTQDNDGTRALLRTLNADGPPTLFIVATKTGREFASTRSVGPFEPENLVDRMHSVTQSLRSQRSAKGLPGKS